MIESSVWTIAVDAPLRPLHYLIPPTFDKAKTVRGASVLVPLGGRKVHGILLAENAATLPSGVKLKSAIEVIDDRPPLPEIYVEWLEWVAKYYCHSLGQTLELAFPPLARARVKKDGTRTKSRKAPLIDAEASMAREDHSVNLTSEQSSVVEAIDKFKVDQGGKIVREFAAHLLFGVTGSGKTEVYMELIARTIARGEQALVLVPEIALTPQLIERFARRFGDKIAVIHSHLTPREKTDNWWAARDGTKPVLIGARSALFCPLEKLGLIVIDEEHESSFKQDETLRYHARDAAVMLARLRGHPIVLGSATPSLESWQNANAGRYQLHKLPSRIRGVQMPLVEVVDLRDSRDVERQAGGRERIGPSASAQAENNQTFERPFWLSRELLTALTDTLDRGEQSALFLNRRGIAQSVVCPSCGHSPECPNCEVALTLHGRSDLICHYCDYHESMKESCGACHDGEPKPLGLGTERIEQDLKKIFPAARLIRMDRDEIQNREDLEDAIGKIEKREVDILIGTQMIAKGLDFPGLTLVGLVLADVAFNLPDFRASERAFQLLTQVAGRAGRHLKDRRGHVILQTYNPEHPSIEYTLQHDFEGFAKHDLAFREALDYPPHGRLAALKFSGPDLAVVERTAQNVATLARKLAGDRLTILGPAPAPLAKLRNMFRYQLLIKGASSSAPVSSFCRTLSEHLDSLAKHPSNPIPPKVKLAIDIDALHLL